MSILKHSSFRPLASTSIRLWIVSATIWVIVATAVMQPWNGYAAAVERPPLVEPAYSTPSKLFPSPPPSFMTMHAYEARTNQGISALWSWAGSALGIPFLALIALLGFRWAVSGSASRHGDGDDMGGSFE